MTLLKGFFNLVICFVCVTSFAQQITVDNTITAQNLIENTLIQGCVEVSNITSPVNGSVNNIGSFGYFEQNNSNFPFQNGIILTTGNANSAGNIENNDILNEGNDTWGADTDLESVLGITNTINATSIEFDIISISNTITFNYILASEEYFDNYPCQYSDGFAFLIRESGTTNPYENIALIPGTTIPVNTNTIHPEIDGECAAANGQFFAGYNVGATNYNGRTEVLTATAVIQPNVQYQIKLVIADQTDQNFDSAVFIQGNSLNSNVDLGDDIASCASSVLLDTGMQSMQATYSWYLDNVLIVGANASTYTALQTGNYRVQIEIPLGSGICTIEDDVNITLSSTQTSNPITDFELCDDVSNDGIALFDLTTKDTEAINSVLSSGNYMVSYHLTTNDAQNNTNAITSPYQNTTNPEVIFIRIEDTDNGCLAFNDFMLIVNPLPTIIDPTPLEVCDDLVANNITSIDLSVKDSEITSGQPNLNVTYHSNANDAATATNPLSLPYTNTTTTEQLFVSVQNMQTGCISTTTLDITVLDNPVINTERHFIDACDADHDGFANFDLTTIIPDVLDGLTNVTVTFHEAENDALSGNNAIADASNFENNTIEEQIIYVRVEDDSTGCASVVPLELYTNMLLTATVIDDIRFCDFENDGVEDVDLNSVEQTIVNNIPDVFVVFYETETDRDNQVNPIDQNTIYQVTNSAQTFYIQLFSTTCTDVAIVDLILVPIQEFQPIGNQIYCDTDQDGITAIDLTSYNDLVSNSMGGFSVNYFLTEDDADTNINALLNTYTNTTNPITIYARVQAGASGNRCFDVTSFQITVADAPITTSPANILICDDDLDGFSIVDLTAVIPEVVSDTSQRTITFHNGSIDANNNANPITNTTAYNAENEVVYIRVENTLTACYAVETLRIFVNTLPVFTPIEDYSICEDSSDGVADFILNTKDAEILNGQTLKNVSYYLSQADADNRVNIINKNVAFQNTTNPQTIYVRVENATDNSCYGTSSFTITVGSNSQFNTPTNWAVCDDAANDGFESFDLSQKVTEISDGINDTLDVTFYTTLNDAENGTNPLPLNYTNTSNPQDIFVQVSSSNENNSLCNSITSFTINVVSLPQVDPIPLLQQCDDAYDGTEVFDLTIAELAITDIRQNNIVVTYFEDISDAQTDTNAITNPQNYTNISNPQTAYVKVLNTFSNCFVLRPVNLMVNLPPVINDFQVYDTCANASNSFNLNEINTVITNEANVSLSYFANQADADANTNQLSTDYTYTTNFDTIYARLENPTTNCSITYQFNLLVNPLPVANQPDDIVVCDDASNDNVASFNLELQTTSILGSQSTSNFTVTYYLNEASATNAVDAIGPFVTANNLQLITARIENNDTGCFSLTNFRLLINPFPNAPLPIYQCDTDYDGTVGVDLTQSESELMLQNPSDNSISYFETVEDLEANTNEILNPETYTNLSNPQTIYIKVFNNVADCHTYVPLVLNINFPPVVNEFEVFEICENPTSTFNLNEINNALVDTTINRIISYFSNEIDAQANTNALDANYTYTTTNDTLYARVQFTTTQCYYVYPFQLRVNPLPIANQPVDIEACDDDFDGVLEFDLLQQNAAILNGQNPNTYSVAYYSSIENANEALEPLETNYYAYNNEIIYARVQNNNTGCYSITNFSAIVNRKPFVNIPNQVVCLNDLPLVVSADTSFSTDTYLWSTGETTPEIEITTLGNYAVTVTSELGCATVINFSVSESESAAIEFIEVLDFSDPNNITITVNGIGNYLYQLDNNPPQTSNIFENVTLGYHTLTVIDVNGCAPTLPREIVVVDAPKFFTPNGNGPNETWHITGVETLPGTIVYIFDRYGKLLKQLAYNDRGWDGTYRGFNMPASDYWFSAEVRRGNISFEVKGHFTLRR